MEGGAIVVKHTGIASANREQNLANVHASHGAVGLAPSAAHAGLQSIGAGAGQHFVDADDVVRVGAHAEVETFFASGFDEISGLGAFVSRLSRNNQMILCQNICVK